MQSNICTVYLLFGSNRCLRKMPDNRAAVPVAKSTSFSMRRATGRFGLGAGGTIVILPYRSWLPAIYDKVFTMMHLRWLVLCFLYSGFVAGLQAFFAIEQNAASKYQNRSCSQLLQILSCRRQQRVPFIGQKLFQHIVHHCMKARTDDPALLCAHGNDIFPVDL